MNQDNGIRGNEILKMYPKLSKATTYGHAKKPVAEKAVDRGRPRKISSRDKGLISLQISILREQYGSFTITPLRDSAGVMKDVSGETVSRASYQFLHSRKKGLLKKDDHKRA